MLLNWECFVSGPFKSEAMPGLVIKQGNARIIVAGRNEDLTSFDIELLDDDMESIKFSEIPLPKAAQLIEEIRETQGISYWTGLTD